MLSLSRGVALGVIAALLAGPVHDARAQDCDGWVALHDIGPRRCPVIVSTGSGALLFGGAYDMPTEAQNGSALASGETWQYIDGRWKFITLEGPAPRSLAAGAFDSTRNCIVMAGGSAGLESPGFDTWEFADGQWVQRVTATVPAVRYGHSMAYSPGRGLTYLYGGGTSVGTGDQANFWSYDGSNWTPIAMTAPNPGNQVRCTLLSDPRDDSLLLIPRLATTPVWRWDGASWSSMPATGLTVSSAVYDPDLGAFIVADVAGRIARYDATGPAQLLDIAPPSNAANAWPTLVRTDNRLLAILGSSNVLEPPPAAYEIDSSGYRPLPTRAFPTATTDVAFGYFPPTHEIVLFGGAFRYGLPSINETWTLRGETLRQSAAASPPSDYTLYLPYVPQQHASVLLGAQSSAPTGWWWAGDRWIHRNTPTAVTSSGTPPAYDASRNAVVWPVATTLWLFDSTVRSITTNTSWGFNNGAFAYDPVRDALVFTGGSSMRYTYIETLNAAHQLAWQAVATNSGPSPNGLRMVYDPDRGGLVAFGGVGGPPNLEGVHPRRTYLLDSHATAWTYALDGVHGPVSRSFHSMEYDPVARRIVMFGGRPPTNVPPFHEVWKLARGPAAVALEPIETYIVPGETAEVFIIASGGGVIDYQWFKDGVALANSARITGADSDTLQIQNFTSDDNGEYHVTVHNRCGDDESMHVAVRAIPTCPGDFDDSGGVDSADLAAFFTAYERGLMLADVDLSGGIDANDVAVFMGSFEAGGC